MKKFTLKEISDERLIMHLKSILDDCLEGMNADGCIRGCRIDRKNLKVFFEFDIIEIPEDNYIGFSTY